MAPLDSLATSQGHAGVPAPPPGRSAVPGAPRALGRAGKGMGRAKRALPRCPPVRSGGCTLQCGEPGAADPEGWGDREPRASQSPSGLGWSDSRGCRPLGSDEPSTAEPKATGDSSFAVQGPGNVIRHSG